MNQNTASQIIISESFIKLGELINETTGNCWCKNTNGEYYGIGNLFREHAKLNNDSIIGKRDHQLPWAETADLLFKNDCMAMQSNHMQLNEEVISNSENQELTFLVVKQAVYDKKYNLLGSIGCSTPLASTPNDTLFGPDNTLTNYAAHFAKLSNELLLLSKSIQLASEKYKEKNTVMLRINNRTVTFTKREIQCLAKLLAGKSAKDTADIYKISAKTVEYYIKQVKNKLNCINRAQIIDIIIQNNLMSSLLNYPNY